MISPTGLGVRKDSEGDGNYGASRGSSRRHNGIDFICRVGQQVVAPFDMLIERVANPKANSKLSGIKWRRGKSEGKMFYLRPDINLIDKNVREGDVIGIAQSVSEVYGLPNMIDHIHLQIDK